MASSHICNWSQFIYIDPAFFPVLGPIPAIYYLFYLLTFLRVSK